MKRLLSTRFGFFALAAIVCWTMLLVIQPEHRFVALGVGCLYAVLSVLFMFEERERPPRGDPADRSDAPEERFPLPPPPPPD
jgi:hypothetical protein